MKNTRVCVRPFLMFLLLGVFPFYVAACQFDLSGRPAPDWTYECETKVWDCVLTNAPLDVKLGGSPEITNYGMEKDLWGNHTQSYKAYYDINIVIAAIGLDALKGSLLIRTGSKDWVINTADFLRVELKNDAEGFYIAYDSRADPKPSWLKQDYTRQDDPNTKQPYYITLSMVDQSKSSPGLVQLEVWQSKTVPQKGQVVNVPGNNYGNPVWQNIKGGNPAMYIVVLKPKSEVSCKGYTNFLIERNPEVRACLLAMEQTKIKDPREYAKALAQELCRQKYGQNSNKVCGETTCKPSGSTNCTYGKKVNVLTFSQGSEIRFAAPSKAEISIQGQAQTSTSTVTGTLHFQYQVSSGDMELNSLILNFAPVQTDVGKFQDIVVGLISPAKAHCLDAAPVFGQPCTNYQILKGDLKASTSVSVDGKPILWFSENILPIKITIDHTTRSFKAKGIVRAIIKINDQDTPMDIALDLYGDFVNFAPKAIGVESTKFAECEENTNKKPVILNAAGSFDIYAPVPTNLPRYEWYEDYGLSTEHLWGKQAKVIIPPHTLAYGVHKFTLIVGDKDGLVDMDTFEVTVGDTTPPYLTIPPDITTPIYPPGTKSVQVDIGQATASDACSQPTIANDAPENLLFPPGVTTVTWQADDDRGNITTAVQKVNVQVVLSLPLRLQGLLEKLQALVQTVITRVLSLPTQLQVEALDMSVSGDYDRVYCYVSFEGAPEVRLPEGASTFIQVQGGQGKIAEWAAGSRRLVLSIPEDGRLDLEGECWGWSGKTLHRLGTFAGKFPSATWDGARRSVEGTGFQIGIAVKPLRVEMP